LDLKAIGEKCRKHDVFLIVDATQAVGIMPFSVKEIQPVMVACSVHKWLRGPSGMSLVYVAKDVQPLWMPLDQHGRSRQVESSSSWDASKDSMGPNGYPEKFVSNARKFDAGGKPNPILLPMLRVAMEKVVRLDLSQVQKYLQELTQPIVDWATRNSFELSPGPQAWHLIGIRPSDSKNMTPDQMIQVVSSLQGEGILIAVRCGAFRISPYIGTQPEDIQVLLDGLSKYCNES
jgi:selenocysteine lyase/cysteine desulfurase